MFGKDTKKKELINNLDQVITICAETEKILSVVVWSQQFAIYSWTVISDSLKVADLKMIM